jgi:hypothetical protein
MLPKFQWNTTTKLIILILIVGLACMVLNYGLIEKFIGDEIINCPDRLYFDGVKYYLFKMNNPIIEGVNPIIYNSYQEYINNKPKQCTELLLTKPFKRELSTKKTLPVLPYKWDCNRDLAFDTAKQNDCINKTYNIFTEDECKLFYTPKQNDCINKTYNIFTEDECKLFDNDPNKYYTNNAVERCMVKNLIKDHPEFIGNLKPTAEIGFTEEGLIRVGSDIGGDPFRNIS